MKNVKAITLISLVITIIILIILAGVAINLTIGKNGILNKAKIGEEKYNFESAYEILNLKITEISTDILTTKNEKITINILDEYMKKGEETQVEVVQYQSTSSLKEGITYTGTLKGIYVIVKKYPQYIFYI